MLDPGSELRTLVLGIGNLLWADEGFGVRAIEALNARYRFPNHVQLMDGAPRDCSSYHMCKGHGSS